MAIFNLTNFNLQLFHVYYYLDQVMDYDNNNNNHVN